MFQIWFDQTFRFIEVPNTVVCKIARYKRFKIVGLYLKTRVGAWIFPSISGFGQRKSENHKNDAHFQCIRFGLHHMAGKVGRMYSAPKAVIDPRHLTTKRVPIFFRDKAVSSILNGDARCLNYFKVCDDVPR